MQLTITGKNIEINDTLRKYVEKKIGRLDRYLPNIIDGRVELTEDEGARAAEDRQIAQVTLRTKKAILRAEEASSDIFASIDAVFEKMQRQVDRYKGKRWAKREARDPRPSAKSQKPRKTAAEDQPYVVRVKQFQMMPMDERRPSSRWSCWGTTSTSSSTSIRTRSTCSTAGATASMA